MITKFNIFKDKLFESLPRQSTVDQLHRIRDEIKKSQTVKIGPESTTMSGDVGDRVKKDLDKKKTNNLCWWDNPLDRYISSYEDFVKKDARKSLGYTNGNDKKPEPTDIPEKSKKELFENLDKYEQEKIRIKNMSEKDFTDWCRTNWKKYQKQIKHSEDSIPFNEWYSAQCDTYGREERY